MRRGNMKKKLIVAGAVLMLCACGNKEKEYDATGTFEATEVTVSAKATGELKTFNISEGQAVEQGAVVGNIDAYQLQQTSEQLEAQKRQLGATRSATDSRRLDLEKQLSSISQQIANAQRERQRFAELVADGAVPKKQLDDINYQIKVLERQREATRDQIRSNNASLAEQSKGIGAQIDGLNAQQRQIADQIANAQVKAPIAGTVLEKYVEQGEFVAIGKPLFKISPVNLPAVCATLSSEGISEMCPNMGVVSLSSDMGSVKSLCYRLHRNRSLHAKLHRPVLRALSSMLHKHRYRMGNRTVPRTQHRFLRQWNRW